MKLTILGSGTSIPHFERTSSGYWLETSAGVILLDLSASVIDRMAKEKLDWLDIDAIWISHFHLDHTGGIASYLFATKYDPAARERTKTLKFYGPKGLKTLIDNFDKVNDYGLLDQPFPVEIIEIDELNEFEILPGIRAVALDTPHTDESLALNIRDGEKTLVYSADTGFTKTLPAFARKANLLILECSFVEESPVDLHIGAPEAVYIVRKAEPELAVFTHLYSVWDEVNFDEVIAQFSPPCPVLEAKDGLKIEI